LALDGDRVDAFGHSMAALCRAIESGIEPDHSARRHLATLALLEAAQVSAREARPVSPQAFLA
jgi:hypothetical protein